MTPAAVPPAAAVAAPLMLLLAALVVHLPPSSAAPVAYPHPYPHPYPYPHPLPYPRAIPDPYPELDAVAQGAEAEARPEGVGGFPTNNGFADDFPLETPAHAQSGDGAGAVSRYARGFSGLGYEEYVGGAPARIQARRAADVSFDDRPFPGDAMASLDTGRAAEPLLPGQRIVEDTGDTHDDTVPIPLADVHEARLARAPRTPALRAGGSRY